MGTMTKALAMATRSDGRANNRKAGSASSAAAITPFAILGLLLLSVP
jgi:hypothetical protein